MRGFYAERRGDWVALVDTDGAVEAFNLDADPGMNQPVADGVAPLWVSGIRFPNSITTDSLAIDDKVREELQALGYVGE